jgi:hypothetical protein
MHRGCQPPKKRNLPIFMEFAGKPNPFAPSYWRILHKEHGLFFRNRPQQGENSFPVKPGGRQGKRKKAVPELFS